jgi:transaldolase
MAATGELQALGQSLWLDNITRPMLTSGTLKRYIDELDVTGLTSNPTIYERAISGSTAYDAQVQESARAGSGAESTFFDLALDDLRASADLFRPVYERTSHVDGYVSLEVSPVLAYEPAETLDEATRLSALGDRPNLLIKIPGTTQGLWAIEEAIFAGIPINVTLLFSPAHYLATADAYTRGIERRVAAGLSALVPSVASVFISRWDAMPEDPVPADLKGSLGLAVGRQVYAAYRSFYEADRWLRLANRGARPQRLLFASTGTKDPNASKTLYVEGLAAPNTIDTMPEETLLAVGQQTSGWTSLASDFVPSKDHLSPFIEAGLDIEDLARTLQERGAASFVKSWTSLLACVAQKAGPSAPSTA